MAEETQAAMVRGMEEGDGRVALGYPLIIQGGDGGQPAAVGHPPAMDPQPSGRPERSTSFCEMFAAAFFAVIGLVLVTDFFLVLFLGSDPSPITVLLFLPVPLLVIAASFACCIAMVFCCDDGQNEGNNRL